MKNRFLLITTCLLFVLFINCSKPTVTYIGKEIKLEFAGVRTIENDHWIEIDGIRYTHSSNFERQQDSLILPASKTVYYIGERERFEPVNPYTIAIALGRVVDFKSIETEQKTARVKQDQRYLLHTNGVLILHNQNGKDVKVEVPKSYPVSIEILNK